MDCEGNIGASTFLIGLWDAKILRWVWTSIAEVSPQPPRVLRTLHRTECAARLTVRVVISMACLRLAAGLPPRLQVLSYRCAATASTAPPPTSMPMR